MDAHIFAHQPLFSSSSFFVCASMIWQNIGRTLWNKIDKMAIHGAKHTCRCSHKIDYTLNFFDQISINKRDVFVIILLLISLSHSLSSVVQSRTKTDAWSLSFILQQLESFFEKGEKKKINLMTEEKEEKKKNENAILFPLLWNGQTFLEIYGRG